MQGLGSMLAEEVKKEAGTGRLISDGTWTYKVPSASCIPRQLNVHFLKDSPNPRGILSSKAVGEPPLLLSVSALSALSVSFMLDILLGYISRSAYPSFALSLFCLASGTSKVKA